MSLSTFYSILSPLFCPRVKTQSLLTHSFDRMSPVYTKIRINGYFENILFFQK